MTTVSIATLNELRVFIAGQFWHGSLEGSLARAFENLGWSVTRWDLPAALQRYVKGGRVGQVIDRFMPVEAWNVKANRELVLAAQALKPQLIIVGGAGPVRAGALGQIRASCPTIKLVLWWPDSLLRLNSHVIECLPLYDLVASYSQAAVDVIQQLGAPLAAWVPLAADSVLHRADIEISEEQRRIFGCDVGFVGNYRPEREQAVLALSQAGFNVKVWGHSEWRRDASDRSAVRRYWQGRPLYGDDFVRAVICSQVSLNPIDPTNYPAANMRFFELLACGGVALNSACPEMESEFVNRETTCYYLNQSDLVAVAGELVEHPKLGREIATSGQRLVQRSHSYVHRVRQVLKSLSLEKA